jgi:hypothetical protein
VLRWFLDGTRLAQLAADNRIGTSTAYRYLHEGIDVLAAQAPDLHDVPRAARPPAEPTCRWTARASPPAGAERSTRRPAIT